MAGEVVSDTLCPMQLQKGKATGEADPPAELHRGAAADIQREGPGDHACRPQPDLGPQS